jgi:hypothetical protein
MLGLKRTTLSAKLRTLDVAMILRQAGMTVAAGHRPASTEPTDDLTARLNRHRAAFESGAHPEKDFQRAWNAHGAVAFEFEAIDTLEPSDESGYDPADDLKTLEQMWLDKLAPNARRALR